MFVRIHNFVSPSYSFVLALIVPCLSFPNPPFQIHQQADFVLFSYEITNFFENLCRFCLYLSEIFQTKQKRNLLLFFIPAKNFSLPLSIFYVSSKNTSIFPFAATVTSLHISFTWQQNFSCSFQITSFASSYTICLFPSTR